MSTQTTPERADRREPGFAQTVGLVAGREISTKLRSKAFVISTIVLMAAVLVTVILSSAFGGQDGATKVAAVGAASDAVASAPGLEAVPADDLDAAEQLLRDGEVEAVVAPTDVVTDAGIETSSGADASATLDLTVIGLDQPAGGVANALAIHPSVAVLDPAPVDPFMAYLVALGFGIVFFFAALTFGQTIAASVVEEKQTRIVEILLATVSGRELLTGKVLGNSVLAIGQVVAIAAVALLGLALTGQQILLGGLGASVIWFVVFFAFGFVLLSSLFAATAALVSRAEDIGSVTMPVTVLVMIPYFLIIFFNDNPTVLAVMSYVPFSAPVGMPMRIFLEQAQWWEPLLSLAILIATTALALVIGDRIYRNSLLRTGARVPFLEALRGK
ncbi:ABC transporter permease [Agromyces sp. LHK192]|uniref:ABC transporter permease n=1 Tax=Agromyces sp. LHK192 TaxID=2498704 RepID=UPI000FD97071|nr:ABC transporter permease [Agromyces sp. LHK192]